jgi:branched-subunit amino acid ABC-type transport system permease component
MGRKEVEKRQNYQDLMFELRTMHPGCEVRLGVLIIAVLGGMNHLLGNLTGSLPAAQIPP